MQGSEGWDHLAAIFLLVREASIHVDRLTFRCSCHCLLAEVERDHGVCGHVPQSACGARFWMKLVWLTTNLNTEFTKEKLPLQKSGFCTSAPDIPCLNLFVKHGSFPNCGAEMAFLAPVNPVKPMLEDAGSQQNPACNLSLKLRVSRQKRHVFHQIHRRKLCPAPISKPRLHPPITSASWHVELVPTLHEPACTQYQEDTIPATSSKDHTTLWIGRQGGSI